MLVQELWARGSQFWVPKTSPWSVQTNLKVPDINSNQQQQQQQQKQQLWKNDSKKNVTCCNSLL